MGFLGKRRIGRSDHFLPSILRLPHGDIGVRVGNLSASGAMVDGISGLAAGQAVSLWLPSLDWVHAIVAWSIETRCGLAFEAPIDPQAAIGHSGHALMQEVPA
jgi:hypothetical protein